ncbi:MAG: tRNA pseudouridine(38-40) synthase TruA [Bacteroidota bacterium]
MKKPQGTQRYFIEVIYQGIAHCGWQKQPNQNTIQDILEKTFQQIGYPTSVTGSSRTDAGVHACKQVAHLDLPHGTDIKKLQRSVNALLPSSIAVHVFKKVKPRAHARFDAIKREYEYRIASMRHPFLYQRCYFYNHKIDIRRINKIAQSLLGEQDFSSLCKAKSDVAHHTCHVTTSHWKASESFISFFIASNRFLHNMVRTAVGTMLALEKDGKGAKELQIILKKKDRAFAGPTLPPEGLFLLRVDYPPTIFQELT